MGDTISIKKVLAEMRSVDIHGEPKPFSIQWVTLNRQKKTGGEIKMLSKAILLNNKGNRKKAPVQGIPGTKRKANHAKHRTMNIKEMIGRVEYGNPIKIHPTLIVRFNGKKVYLS